MLRLPRPGTLAAGGAVLAAQVWGLGVGVAAAYAAGSPAGSAGVGAVGRTDAPELLGDLVDTAAPVLDRPVAPVEQVLQERIRAGGLPLPGQVATVPDAFAIATVLVSGVPAQGRGEDVQRASRSAGTAGGGAGRGGAEPAVPAQRTAPPSAVAVVDGRPAGSRPGAVVRDDRPVEEGAPSPDELALAAATPARPDGGDTGTAVLGPIAAGLLLTGAAMYKHRGLPGGH